MGRDFEIAVLDRQFWKYYLRPCSDALLANTLDWITYIFSTGAGYLDPCLGEEGAGAEHEDDVEDRVDGVFYDVG